MGLLYERQSSGLEKPDDFLEIEAWSLWGQVFLSKKFVTKLCKTNMSKSVVPNSMKLLVTFPTS